jgi:glycosyltransferase involved in cell wall biosynthesis
MGGALPNGGRAEEKEREGDDRGASPPAVTLPLSVVIVTYNSAHCIAECIQAVRRVLGDCELIVVDNRSQDGTVMFARDADPLGRVIPMGRNAGYGTAVNSGVSAATNDHVMVMNPDVILERADREGLMSSMERESLGLMALALRADGEQAAHPHVYERGSWSGELATMALGPFRPHGLRRRFSPARPHAVAWAAGALFLVRREEFQRLGGFNQRFFLYYEDQELGLRYRRARLPVGGSDLVNGTHVGGRSAADDDQRIGPMAWCVLGWLEFVALQHGIWRTRLSWRIVSTTHRLGRRGVEWSGRVTRLRRFRRKAEQLSAVHELISSTARAGAEGEHSWCPTACRVVASAEK